MMGKFKGISCPVIVTDKDFIFFLQTLPGYSSVLDTRKTIILGRWFPIKSFSF